MLSVRIQSHLIKSLLVRGISSTSAKDTAQVQVAEETVHTLQPKIKKGKCEPFVKNLFLGKFDKGVLKFPQALDRDQHETLHEMVGPIEKFFLQDMDSAAHDRNAHIPDSVLNQCKEFGLYGQQIPVEYGGLGLGATEYSRLAEIIAEDGGIAVTLAAHQAIGLKGLLLEGSDYLKEKYLPKLATGEYTAAFCLTEPGSGSDAASIQTRAVLADDGKTWLLSGGKVWISNGGTADVFTVFARTEVDGKDKISAFFVERAFGGVTSGPPEDKMGIRGSNTAEVHFDNTPVPSENVIGEVGRGFKLAVTILNSGRFSMGSATAGTLKRGMAVAMEHAQTRKQFGCTLSEFGLIKEKFAKTAVSIYAMESMAYLSAGIIDTYEEQDTSIEAAIVKVYSSAKGWELGSEMLQIMGGLGYMRSYPYERYLRDGRICLIFEGTNEILRMFIALMGIQHAAPELRDVVKKMRNPLMNPGFVMSSALRQVRDTQDKPKMNLDIKGSLHPSLTPGADSLEYCTHRFRFAVQILLARYGTNIVKPEHQMEVVRLADMAIDLYAMTSVLSRASRSYCIGLHNSQHEVQLALTYCKEAEMRIRRMMSEIQNGCNHLDLEYSQIADALFAKGGYAAEHPLAVNGW